MESDRTLLSRILEGIFIAVVAGVIVFFITSYIKDYRDGSGQASEPSPEFVKPKNLHVGDVFTYGEYEQDNDRSNGSEQIDWIVLKTQGNRALVISLYGLERKSFQDNSSSATWSNSSLRSWLNGEFYLYAFNEDERKYIMSTSVDPAPNPDYPGIDAGERTTDRVFLLSREEAETYFSDNEDRQCKATQLLINQNAFVRDGYCWWWLRNPGNASDRAMGVTTYGAFQKEGEEGLGSVRPAMWVDFS